MAGDRKGPTIEERRARVLELAGVAEEAAPPSGDSGPPERFYTGCAGKARHESEMAAQKAVRANRRRGHRVEAYRCSLCHGWHVAKAKRT